MKTIADLNALTSTLEDLLRNADHEIGATYYEQDEDGWGKCEDWDYNYLLFEEDGWVIEIEYECNGVYADDPGDYDTPPCDDLLRARGRITDINASHYDEETEEETEFSDEDLKDLVKALDRVLEDIV